MDISLSPLAVTLGISRNKQILRIAQSQGKPSHAVVVTVVAFLRETRDERRGCARFILSCSGMARKRQSCGMAENGPTLADFGRMEQRKAMHAFLAWAAGSSTAKGALRKAPDVRRAASMAGTEPET
ncbi:hypothetical protein Trco_007987 [Trichoderma cornu-damae]|uniref:Uncharacterized protein n=1 Tax=Trichoderma cornu-damae TaxID=654480 RepID=A0A9P8QII4_9HYPO|nr:hypothetical protein Trco_007987 [Trichoderma cornu-damae]